MVLQFSPLYLFMISRHYTLYICCMNMNAVFEQFIGKCLMSE